ncbi:O-antigen ligase family protein [Mogibacterium sp.]|uniref:O-antigen ligase family protein n=1 Tax=Mogibacterium sp. TaxID=2049035 RepID=UPI002583BA65|nr:O-antigen ligase family protein [Mogibacterium sp.]MCI7123105.1 O-antigen ligase family protein [Mogibacterium sp.]MDY4171880.1 O-antigen ligase family protein [Evtepia sp.]
MNRMQLNEGASNRRMVLSERSVGVALFCLYIFISSLANDMVFPSSIGSLTLYLFLGYSVLYILLNKKLKINRIIKWMLVFIAFCVFTMLYSPEKGFLSDSEFYLLIVNFILILFLSQYDININDIKKISWANILSGGFLIFILFARGNLTGFSTSNRFGQDLFGNSNILANLLMKSALYAIWLLVYSENKIIHKMVLTLCLVASYYGMFLSGGRKFIIIPAIFLYILLFFKRDSRGRKHLVKYTGVVIAIVIAVYYLIMNVPAFYAVIGERMESLFSFIRTGHSISGKSAEIRATMIEIGFNKWMDSPIWGYGFDSFKYYNRLMTGHFYYSHNNYIELLYDLGIIGFAIYYWFYWKLFYVAWKGKNSYTPEIRAFVIGIVFSMLVFEYGAVNYTVTSTQIMLFFAYTLLKEPRYERRYIDE